MRASAPNWCIRNTPHIRRTPPATPGTTQPVRQNSAQISRSPAETASRAAPGPQESSIAFSVVGYTARVETTTLLQRLVQIDSVNPGLTAGAAGEGEVVAYLRDYLGQLPVEVRLLEGTRGRPTLVATLRGTGGGRSLLLNAHTDTVGVEGMEEPFSGRIANGRLYGRGSYDMKGGLAAAVEAFAAVARSGPLAGDLVLAAVADEEHGSLGTEELLRQVRTDAAIVTEPTALGICIAHKGFLWVEIRTEGRAAHGSRPDLGVDANLEMGRVLGRLADLEARLRNSAAHPLTGGPSLHVARMEGGTAWSTYSAECRIQVERRLQPGERAEAAFRELQEAAAPHAARLVLAREAFEAPTDTPFFACVREAVRKTTGVEPEIMGQTPWFDAALLADAGIETLILGHDGAGAHAAEEWADLESVEALARVLRKLAADWCRGHV
jgi:acetylornithine deacetylase